MNTQKKYKIAVIHPRLAAGGGSEAFAAWLIESLKVNYEVYIITMGLVDIDRLNQHYGTSFKEGEVKIISLPLSRFFKNRFDALRDWRLARYCQRRSSEFDLMISTYNVMNLGKKGIQCIADFSFDDRLRRKFDGSSTKNNKWFYQKSLLRNLYIGFAHLLSGNFPYAWKDNITLANSIWTQRIMKENYDMDSIVVYPPASGEFPEVLWNKKENGFVYLGRISPEKQIEKIIRIVSKVREANPDISLHIIGKLDNSEYGILIKNLCQQHSAWCFLEGEMSGQKKIDFISKYKYGISARPNEPFGIAVAEMVRAGCVVFVPAGGGQTEIVNHSQLMYQNEADAVEKITHVVTNVNLQETLLYHLTKNAQLFLPEKFKADINKVVEKYFHE